MIAALLVALALGQTVNVNDGKIAIHKGPNYLTITDAGEALVNCTNCSGGGAGGTSAPTIDGGVLGSVTWIDGGWLNATVSNFPATFWPNLQWVSVDGGISAFITNQQAQWFVADGGYVNVLSLPAIVLDGGVNVSSLPAVVIDGGVNISALPAVVIDGGVFAQGVDPNGAAHTILTDQLGAQYISSPKPLPLPKCNPVRRYNCQ